MYRVEMAMSACELVVSERGDLTHLLLSAT